MFSAASISTKTVMDRNSVLQNLSCISRTVKHPLKVLTSSHFFFKFICLFAAVWSRTCPLICFHLSCHRRNVSKTFLTTPCENAQRRCWYSIKNKCKIINNTYTVSAPLKSLFIRRICTSMF